MSDFAHYVRLLRYARPYWRLFVVAILGLVAVAVGDLLMTILVIPIVRSFQGAEPAETRWLPLAIIGVFVLRGLGSYVSTYGMGYAGNRVVFDLRREMINKLLTLPTAFYDVTPSGALQSRLTFDAYQIASTTSDTLTTAIRSALTIAGSVGWLVYLNWRLTIWTFVILPVTAWVIRLFSRRLRRVARDVQKRTASMTQVLEEIIRGHRIVRIFGGEAYERARVTHSANALRNAMSKQSASGAASAPAVQILAALAAAVIIWIALNQTPSDKLDLALSLSYMVALFALLDRIKAVSGINASIQRGLAAADTIFDLLDHEDEPDSGKVKVDGVRGDLRFDHVTLRYPGTKTAAVSDFSLHVRPGQTIALVGRSGSGKTSVVNLIPRFYEPSSGRLFVDGHDVTSLTLASLRRHIALVSQDVMLFDDTIAANIAYGSLTGLSHQEIERAAAAAHALEFIRAMKDGFNTRVGEKGIRLSGGQRQRIAIARAILKDATILLLDEATSSLDSESERQVQEALDALMRGRTTIVIAHRLSTILGADSIVVLEHGCIVEQGSPLELQARGGLFTHFHRLAFATGQVDALSIDRPSPSRTDAR